MEHFDRFTILRLMLPQDRYDDAEVADVAERCCERLFRAGDVVNEPDPHIDDWLVVIDGELEVSDGERRWTVGPGAIVHPSLSRDPGIAKWSLVATRPTAVLQVAIDETQPRQ